MNVKKNTIGLKKHTDELNKVIVDSLIEALIILMKEYEYELQNYGVKNIPTTLTIQDFDKIVNGVQ